jgi:N-glycosylase/DNA lyase
MAADTLVVAAPPPFSFDTVVRSHGWYDLPPFEYDARAAELRVRMRTAGTTAALRFHAAETGIAAGASNDVARRERRAAAVRIFSLSVDLRPFLARAADDPDLSWAAARGAGRFLRAPSLWEDAVKMLLTTNCSWAATRGMVIRAIDRFGVDGAFPEPEAIARTRESALNAAIRSGYRTGALLALARGVASGRVDLAEWESPRLDSGEIRARILERRGFGPYAAEGLLRLIGRHDFFAIDSWTRTKYRKLHPGRGAIERSIARRYAKYGEFRGLAFWLDLTRDWHEKTETVW